MNTISFQTRIYQVVFGLALFAVASKTVSLLLANGAKGSSLLPLVVIGFVAVSLLLESRFWILIPILFQIPVKIPGLPFSYSEIAVIYAVTIYSIRATIGRQRSFAPNRDALIFVPFLVWVFFMFLVNPTGLNIFGSGTIGGRGYFDAVIATMFLFIFSRISFSENDCRLYFRTLFACAIINLCWRVFATNTSVADATRYEFTFSVSAAIMLLCRYPLLSFFSLSYKFVAILFLTSLTLISGKRAALGRFVITPLFLCLLRRRDWFLTLSVGFVALFVLSFVAYGHGALYNLPSGVQRTMSFFPGNWDQQIENTRGFKDVFRIEMRRRGRIFIANHPWTGRKGYAQNFEETAYLAASRSANSHFEGQELAGGYHNIWYSIAADFGLPALALALFLSFGVVRTILRDTQYMTLGKWSTICAHYYAVNLLLVLALSWWSGNTRSFLWEMSTGFALFLVFRNSEHRAAELGQGVIDKITY